MKTNQVGIDLIKKFEGLRLHVYLDLGGVATVGYGHVDSSLKLGQYITEDQANEYFLQDLAIFEHEMTMAIRVVVTSNQFSALVSLVYNVGFGNLLGKGLMKKLNSADYQGAANSFVLYDHVNGKEDAGLLKRRLAEKALFLTPDADPSENNSLDKALQILKDVV